MTMNSPDSLLQLYGLANSSKYRQGESHGVYTAELMREVGLKCIGLNGVCLLSFLTMHDSQHADLPCRSHAQSIVSVLSTGGFQKMFEQRLMSANHDESLRLRRRKRPLTAATSSGILSTILSPTNSLRSLLSLIPICLSSSFNPNTAVSSPTLHHHREMHRSDQI